MRGHAREERFEKRAEFDTVGLSVLSFPEGPKLIVVLRVDQRIELIFEGVGLTEGGLAHTHGEKNYAEGKHVGQFRVVACHRAKTLVQDLRCHV